MFALGVPLFAANLVLSGWLKYRYSQVTTWCITAAAAAGALAYAYVILLDPIGRQTTKRQSRQPPPSFAGPHRSAHAL
jgi:hypothetical protein